MAYGNTVVEPIATIGTGCRLPGGSSSPSRLWTLLKNPRVVASEAPGDRFNINAFYHEDPGYPGTTNSKEAYYLSDDPRPFDAPFFNISATEAKSIDPQQRQLLETVYESLEAAGLRLEALQGSSTGIFCGVMNNDWGELQSADYKSLPQYLATGAARSIIANRISMVALHHAVTALQQNECTPALATGTNLIQAPNIFISTTNIQMLSPTGRSRMWDANADGYARGEGVISIGNGHQPGRTNNGVTMPSSLSQLQLIQNTYARAGLDPRRVQDRCQYFEAQGTGTLAGDPQEAAAIHQAFFGPPASRDGVNNGCDISANRASKGTPANDHEILLVGSVKTVVGHTKGTAGLAGNMKATLSLQHGLIAPNLLFETLSPALEPFASHLKVVTEPIPWPPLPTGVPRRVSVNSFGFGGTNAHAILESYDASVKENVLNSYAGYLKGKPALNLVDFASLGSSIEELVGKIEEEAEAIGKRRKTANSRRCSDTPRILGVFTGQGAQWTQMGWELVGASPVARGWLEEMQNSLVNLRTKYRPSFSLTGELSNSVSKMRSAALSQPLCTALQIIIVNFLRAISVSFTSVVGHSSGEIAAAYAAGYLTATDAIRVAYLRGFVALMAGARNGQPGAMLAADVSAREAADICAKSKGKIALAAENAPSSVTFPGDADAIQLLEKRLKKENKFCRTLQVDTAYHSHHMQPCCRPYLDALEECNVKVKLPPTAQHGIPLYIRKII
ncbi:thiolase-like protein [Aspergillus terricola var. indicus]